MKLYFFAGALFLFSCNNNTSGPVADSPAKINIDSSEKISADKIINEIGSSETVNFNTNASGLKLISHAIHLQKGIDFNLNIPDGYHISIAAEGLQRLRFLSKSPDGRLFATDMFNKDDNRKGKVLIFQDWDSSTHRFKKISTGIDSLHNPNQVAFFDKYIYVAETDKLSRYHYNNGDTTVSSPPEIIANFPDYGLSYKYGGWHLTRSISFHKSKLYVSVGSSCNACIEREEVRAAIMEMNADGTDKKIYARGLRNSVGIKWIGDVLWATGMGRDLIGPDKPEDIFQTVEEGGYYGWPFYFQYQNRIYADDQFKDSVKAFRVNKPPVAFAGFKAHSAPLGFDHFKNFDDPFLNNSVLVALHGSTTVSRQRGNAIVKVLGGNRYIDIVNGFLKGTTEAERYGRPCDILMNDNHSFFITDDQNGVLYYIWK